MLMKREMGVKKAGSYILLVLLLLAFLGVSLGEKGEIKELFGGSVNPATENRNENVAKSSWEKCRLELIKLKEVYAGLGFSTLDISGIFDGDTPVEQALTQENVQKALTILQSLVGKNPLDCLREEYIVLPVSGEEVSSTKWYLEHLKPLFSKLDTSTDLRQHLARELLERTAKPPSSAPSRGSSSSHSSRPASPPAPPPPKSSSVKKSNSQSSNHEAVVTAVVVTAVLTFFISVVLFLCCRKAFRKGSGFDYKDDRPLLSLSLSESLGSSGKPYVVDNSFKKLESQSYEADPSQRKGNGSAGHNFSLDGDILDAPSNGITKVADESGSLFGKADGNVPNLPLKPPPGRFGVSAPQMIPLKPPPGRAEPLPHEPPASLRLPPSRPGPPPPPPPPAPLPPRQTSGSVAPRPPPGPPPPPPVKKPGVPPPRPPPPKSGVQLPRPPPPKLGLGTGSSDDDAPRTKLKPFFWDKVLANPDHSMVWDQIKSGSFQFNEEMIETLFGYTPPEKSITEQKKESSSRDPSAQFIKIIDPKKAQNLAILLRALNVTNEEVNDALQEGKELPPELLETLLKMAPTPEEELKLRLYSGELSRIGPSERFLKMLVDIPFAFKRLESLFFMSTIQEDVAMVKESFTTLEVACKELRSSRLFLKLLEAVLKTGNRMNVGTFRGGAQAFKLDTLLKLSDVRGTDGKTTLLHFVVQEIIRTEGIRAARALRDSESFSSIKSEDLLDDIINEDTEEHYRTLGLQVVSGLGGQLENVRKAACLDADVLTGTIAKLGNSLIKTRNFLNNDIMQNNIDDEEDKGNNGFHKVLKSFVQHGEGDIIWLLEEEKRVMGLVKSTVDYFHGNSGKDEGLRLFVIVRDFLIMLDKACKEVRENPRRPSRRQKRDPPSRQTSTETPRQPPSSPDLHLRLFPAIAERRVGDDSSSDDD
ncbi:hypothetical protein Dimus_019094 [Dionaea muscipula]